MPILESFAYNCPVVLSDIDIFHEVAGDAGIYINPNNKINLYDAIYSVVYSDSTSSEYKQKGQDRIKDFSWDKCAQETYDVYGEMVKSI